MAVDVYQRKTSRPTWQLLTDIVAGTLVTSLLLWTKLLVTEGWRFFLTYSRFSIIRQVAQAYRDCRCEFIENGGIVELELV